MTLEINLGIKENLKSGYTTLFFNLSNKDKINPNILRMASKYFSSGWSGVEQGVEVEKDPKKLYSLVAERLAGFFKEVSKEKPAVHYYLISNYNERVQGAYVSEEVYKNEFIRNLTADELRNMALEVKKALEGL